jgi:hypothetical protein
MVRQSKETGYSLQVMSIWGDFFRLDNGEQARQS